MTLLDKLKLFCASERSDEEIGDLFMRANTALVDGLQLNKAIEMSLDMAHKKAEIVDLKPYTNVGRKPELLLSRHKATILELRLEGHGYGAIAKILAKRNIYNKQTKKAFSRHTIKNALVALEKEKQESL
jgi:hypothetical protein